MIGGKSMSKFAPLLCIFILVFIPPPSNTISQYENNTWLVDFIDENPYSAYYYAANISSISTNKTLARYSFRVGGSPGEYHVYLYLKSLLESWGLEVKVEEFNFINWDIYSEPNITLYIGDEVKTVRIYPEHYTFGTPERGLIGNLTYLPLPLNLSQPSLPSNITEIWDKTNISGKILLIGREVLFNRFWSDQYFDKIRREKPLAILYTWVTNDFKNYPPFFSSTAGRRYSLYREYRLPIAWIPRKVADEIITALETNETVMGEIRIPIRESNGVVRNIIANIPGKDKSKMLLITAHYDSVMTPALCDNAAGAAGVLELAWAFSKAVQENIYTPPINITFIFFTCEEAGLIGSAKYIELHKKEIKENLIGVINLDTLGSYKMEVSTAHMGLQYLKETIYIHDIVVSVGESLGIEVEVFDDLIHSDDSSFTCPACVYGLISSWWPDFPLDFSDVVPSPAVMIGSTPYLPWQVDSEGRRGWIHTPYDNTTSTEIYDWVNPNRLELQIKVAGLSVLEILGYYEEEEAPPRPTSELLPILELGLIVVLITLGVVVIYKKRRD